MGKHGPQRSRPATVTEDKMEDSETEQTSFYWQMIQTLVESNQDGKPIDLVDLETPGTSE